jgi:hypothetical protein
MLATEALAQHLGEAVRGGGVIEWSQLKLGVEMADFEPRPDASQNIM